MRLNTKIIASWLLFSLVLLVGLLLFEWQLRTLQSELSQHVSLHQQAVRLARELRFLSLQRLATALQHQPGQTALILDGLAASEQRTEQLITALEALMSPSIHEPALEGSDQGLDILTAYRLAGSRLPDLYTAWLRAREGGARADEPLARFQLLQQFDRVEALLEDLSRYHEINQDQVTAQATARIDTVQRTFYAFIAIALLVALAFARYQGHTIATPLRQLSHAARAVADGKAAGFQVRSSVSEIGALNDAINTMVGQLRGYVEQLATRQEEILGQMAEMAHVGGWELDLETGRLTWTREVFRLHELDPASSPELERALDFYAPEGRPLIQAAVEGAARDGTPWDLELPFITAKGRHLWVRALGRPVCRQDKVVRLNGAFQDITEQKRTLDAIRQANADLEGFSYSVSHDLRAPLRAIDGFIAMLLEDHAGQLDAEGRRMFGVVQDNARKMGRLIDDILAFSRAGRLELDWQTVDTQALVQEVWASLDEQRADHEVRLELGDDLPAVWGDPRALRQIWSNLLGNAIKFCRDRHPGRIRVTAERLDDWVQFSVQDNGVGFDPAYAGKLFVLFQRLHGMTGVIQRQR
ncbi:MAG: HAMP domain-containing protein [Gammaproteobacteria bacterium]|nr:HAMP domain-containing protein [Gammaproteobacteria bacterium]